ncbi:hypothetical protein V1517DRAFT_376392 [Lipomyces orientalis]|uniref:Uncharacterized protein n=1 Tax=Lipomyces orientalis TaxID=1233043 RepID=A0ACC3TEJ3_9ASCO
MCKIVAQLYLWSQDADKFVESWLSRNFEDLTSNQLVVPALLRNQLIHANRLDSVICSWLEKSHTTESVRFVATLVCDLIAGYPRLVELKYFSTTLDMLHRVCTGPTFHIPQSMIATSMEMDNNQQSTASESDVMCSAFKTWIELTAKQPRSATQESDFLRRLILRGMFDESRNLDAFFRPALGYCAQLYHDANDLASELMREEGYKAVCGLADLVIRSYEFSELGDTCRRLFIVNHIFANVLAFVMHISQTGEVKDKLDGRPYYYFFMHTLQLLHDSTELDREAKRGMYIYLADCFHFIRPAECLFFVLLWTNLVSDEQLFVNHMLEDEESTGILVELLCSGMNFIGKYLRASGMYALVRDVDIMLQKVFVSLARARPDFMATHKGRFTDAVHEWQDGHENYHVE